MSSILSIFLPNPSPQNETPLQEAKGQSKISSLKAKELPRALRITLFALGCIAAAAGAVGLALFAASAIPYIAIPAMIGVGAYFLGKYLLTTEVGDFVR